MLMLLFFCFVILLNSLDDCWHNAPVDYLMLIREDHLHLMSLFTGEAQYSSASKIFWMWCSLTHAFSPTQWSWCFRSGWIHCYGQIWRDVFVSTLYFEGSLCSVKRAYLKASFPLHHQLILSFLLESVLGFRSIPHVHYGYTLSQLPCDLC